MIVVVAGAGASAAVNHERYKTTAGFLSSIPPQVRGDDRSLFNRALHHVKKSKEEFPKERRVVDIEEVLGWLDQLAIDIRSFGSLKNLLAMHDGGADVKKEPHDSYNKDEVNSFFGAVNPMRNWPSPIKAIEEVTKGITALLWNVYAHKPEDAELAENWLPLIEACLERDPLLEIFTLNYDPVIETALDKTTTSVDVIDGFQRRRFTQELDLGAWGRHRELTGTQRVFFTKLHGSLDWSKRGSVTERSGWQRPAMTDDYILIPPILRKKVQLMQPFKTFYDRLHWAVANADHVYSVGYAHRDEDTNEALKRARQPIRVVNRDRLCLEPLEKAGVAHKPLISEKGFCVPAIREALFRMET